MARCTSSSDDIVIKSPYDRRLYRLIKLDNGLTALLVHDPEIYPQGESELSKAIVQSEADEEEEDEDDEDEDSEGEDDEDDEDDDDDEENDDEDGEGEEAELKKKKGGASQTKKVGIVIFFLVKTQLLKLDKISVTLMKILRGRKRMRLYGCMTDTQSQELKYHCLRFHHHSFFLYCISNKKVCSFSTIFTQMLSLLS